MMPYIYYANKRAYLNYVFVRRVNVYLSIKLYSFVHYCPRDVHRIADKLNNAL